MLEELLPHFSAGSDLEIQVITGSEFIQPQDEYWQEYLSLRGLGPTDIEYGFARAPQGEAGGLSIGALRIPGAEWGLSLAALSAVLEQNGNGTVRFERVTLGGREVIRRLGEPAAGSILLYYPVGSTLFTVQTADEEIAKEAVRQLPASSGDAIPAPDASVLEESFTHGSGDFGMGWKGYGSIGEHFKACVGYEEFIDVFLFYGAPGTLDPIPNLDWVMAVTTTSFGATANIIDESGVGKRVRYYNHWLAEVPETEHLRFTAIDLATRGQHSRGVSFEVHMCLNGLWEDPNGPRTIRIDQDGAGSLTGTVLTGEPLCGESEVAFTGSFVGGDQVALYLTACNPELCVDAGLLPVINDRTLYNGTVKDDVSQIEGRWWDIEYDGRWNEEGELIACTESGNQPEVPLTFTRQSFGPDTPWD